MIFLVDAGFGTPSVHLLSEFLVLTRFSYLKNCGQGGFHPLLTKVLEFDYIALKAGGCPTPRGKRIVRETMCLELREEGHAVFGYSSL